MVSSSFAQAMQRPHRATPDETTLTEAPPGLPHLIHSDDEKEID